MDGAEMYPTRINPTHMNATQMNATQMNTTQMKAINNDGEQNLRPGSQQCRPSIDQDRRLVLSTSSKSAFTPAPDEEVRILLP